MAVPLGMSVPLQELFMQKPTLPAPGAPRYPFDKGTFSSPSKITMLKSSKKASKRLVPLCQRMLLIPAILLSPGLSSSVLPPEIAWVVLSMFVPFLSALVISWVPLGWGKGHGTKVASLKRLCFPCAGIKSMAPQSLSTLDSLSCPPLPECRPCASPHRE